MTISNLPSGTVTFLFTDIEGSTKLAQEHREQWENLRLRHHAILQSAMDAYNGHVFQIIGDAFCVAFHTASDGLYAAVETQRKLQSEEWGETPIKVRMGIHTGEAKLQSRDDYHGYLAMSHVQRLMSAGHGGQILLSQATQDLVMDGLVQEITLQDMGLHRLKDLLQPEHIFQVNVQDLQSVFPVLKTLNVQLNNLPTQLTHFIGRDREIAAVVSLLRNPEVHLVTLTGTGGTGKTRLSLQVAADLLEEYEHGVWFVELASITDPVLFLPTVASTLKVKETAGKPIADVLNEYLADKQLLLVLDNFEQLVSATPKISGLLNAAPKVKVLVSSREVLRLRGEHDYPVPPLGLPESKRKQTAAVLAQYEAIALFAQHAQAANPSFVLDEGNASTIADICSRLDGLPLALELAAARSRLFKPAAMLDKLKNRFDVLTGGARDLPRRQQTIRGTIDWSYDLLNEVDKKLFAQLGIFVGGWTLESAEAVCGSGLDALNGIESLLDKSLIRQFEGVSGETRFTMLETIREYAFEKLSQRTEFESIRQKHADVIAALLEKVRFSTGTAEGETWFARLDDELDNLRSAVEWTLENHQPSLAMLAGRLKLYWYERLNFREPLRWLERALEMQGDMPLIDKAYALNSAGTLCLKLLDMPRAKMYYEAASPLFLNANDKTGLSEILNNLGNMESNDRNFEKAQQLYEECLAYAEPDSLRVAMTSINLGNLARIRGDWEGSKKYFLQTMEVSNRLGSETGVSSARTWLAALALVQRNMEEARKGWESALNANWIRTNPLYRGVIEGQLGYVNLLMGNEKDARRRLKQGLETSLEYLNQTPSLPVAWILIEGQARLDVMDGHMERAAQLFGASWTQREEDDWPLTEFERPEYEARIAEVRAGMGDAAFEAAFQKGQAMSLKEAMQFALG